MAVTGQDEEVCCGGAPPLASPRLRFGRVDEGMQRHAEASGRGRRIACGLGCRPFGLWGRAVVPREGVACAPWLAGRGVCGGAAMWGRGPIGGQLWFQSMG